MRSIFAALVAAALGLVAAPSAAQVEAKSAWSRATVPGQKTSSAYMQLKSAQAARLVGAQSPAAAIVELHEMRMDGNVMRMRAAATLELPAGKLVELKPGGYHFMLIDLKAALKKGDSVPLTLKIESKDKKVTMVEVRAEVRDKAP